MLQFFRAPAYCIMLDVLLTMFETNMWQNLRFARNSGATLRKNVCGLFRKTEVLNKMFRLFLRISCDVLKYTGFYCFFPGYSTKS